MYAVNSVLIADLYSIEWFRITVKLDIFETQKNLYFEIIMRRLQNPHPVDLSLGYVIHYTYIFKANFESSKKGEGVCLKRGKG